MCITRNVFDFKTFFLIFSQNIWKYGKKSVPVAHYVDIGKKSVPKKKKLDVFLKNVVCDIHDYMR